MMLWAMWLRGVLLRRTGRIAGVALGIAATVALAGTLAGFVAHSAATMTARASATVPIDWQVLVRDAREGPRIAAGITAIPTVAATQPVLYADVRGFSSRSAGTVQTTGAGVAVGMDAAAYEQRFPHVIRPLLGAAHGVLIAQQTAANLHAAPGSTIVVTHSDGRSFPLHVDGVVDMPAADAFFQRVGAPASAQRSAPPDNVVLVPPAAWRAQLAGGTFEVHVALDHRLPGDPQAAALEVQRRARNVEALFAGGVTIADNLGVRLEAVRGDALYARVMFLFLGAPGAVLAAVITTGIAGSGAERRRREYALLRARGASLSTLMNLAASEALVVACAGVAVGIVAAASLLHTLGATSPIPGGVALGLAAAGLAGTAFALAAMLLPALRDTRSISVAAARAPESRPAPPLWQRLYVDVALLAVALLAYAQIAASGYQLVLAPEGVPQSSVAYQGFLAPVCFWLGACLFVRRLAELALARGKSIVSAMIRPAARDLAPIVASSLSRRRRRIGAMLLVIVLAFAYTASVAIFNSTYDAQARVDAELTNGADVAVSGTSPTAPGKHLPDLARLPGVASASAMQHRFAYVGNDVQDLYGIDVQTLLNTTNIANAYFANNDARGTMRALASTPDGVLVAEETAAEYQLHPRDRINLRLQSRRDHAYHPVAFRFAGVVREFPTAPKDSFLVANASYVAQATGNSAPEIVLLRTTAPPAVVAQRAGALLAGERGITVTDITSAQKNVGSSLTAVDLRGLTTIELAFGVLLVVGATGLLWGLDVVERRRTLVTLDALGARRSQRNAFVWSEALVTLAAGVPAGLLIGTMIAEILVKLVAGAFDPPPEHLTVPFTYLVVTTVAGVAAIVAAIALSIARVARHETAALREAG